VVETQSGALAPVVELPVWAEHPPRLAPVGHWRQGGTWQRVALPQPVGCRHRQAGMPQAEPLLLQLAATFRLAAEQREDKLQAVLPRVAEYPRAAQLRVLQQPAVRRREGRRRAQVVQPQVDQQPAAKRQREALAQPVAPRSRAGPLERAAPAMSSRAPGCGKTPTLLKSTPPPGTKMNYNSITSGGQSRRYLLWYPDNYDNTHAYRLVFAYHWYSGSASQVFDCNTESIKCYTTQTPFYGLLNLANNSTIFVAPDGTGSPLGWPNSGGQDVTFTDDMLTQIENDLCIDKSRIFANGFSYGAGMSYALACARASVFRAVGVYSGGQLSGCSGGTTPIAYYASHGLDDGTLAISGGRTMRDHFVSVNGCTAQSPPEPASGSGTHICTTYSGCSAGHPVRWCAFAGSNGHDPSPKDPGQSTTWNPGEVWKFFTQF
jgi:poly(3-hydroxybutyrate) depolymerase